MASSDSPSALSCLSLDATAAATQLAHLPDGLLARILSFLPLSSRMQAALTCSQLARAAAAATMEISKDLADNAQRTASMFLWLKHHGSSLTSLELERIDRRQLRKLVLTGSNSVQLGYRTRQQDGIVKCCPDLTQLHMQGRLQDWERDMEALPQLVHLQHLEFLPSSADDNPMAVPNSFFQLQQLTYLHIRGDADTSDSFLLQLTKLSKLHTLYVVSEEATAAGLSTLHHLQHLQDLSLFLEVSRTTPSISQLTALTALRVKGAFLEPGVLSPLTGLVQVHLDNITVTSAAALLDVLSRMPLLQQLKVGNPEARHGDLGSNPDWPPASSAAYGVFAALTDLKALQLTWCLWLPAGVWAGIFPAGRQLTALTKLVADWNIRSIRHPDLVPALLGSADMGRIVRCCPNLRAMRIDLQHQEQVPALAQLTGLTGLVQLKVQVLELSREGLLSLTALTKLTELWYSYGPWSWTERYIRLQSQAGPDAPPEVWQQLQQRCAQME